MLAKTATGYLLKAITTEHFQADCSFVSIYPIRTSSALFGDFFVTLICLSFLECASPKNTSSHTSSRGVQIREERWLFTTNLNDAGTFVVFFS